MAISLRRPSSPRNKSIRRVLTYCTNLNVAAENLFHFISCEILVRKESLFLALLALIKLKVKMCAQLVSGAELDDSFGYRRKPSDERGSNTGDRAVAYRATDVLTCFAPGDIIRGTVAKVESFGAFIELECCRGLHGLVHISQMAKDRVDNVADIVSTGDQVYVKVLSIEDGTGERPKPRVSLSMKYCSQSDGSDKDPNGILAEQEQRRKRTRHEGITVI